MLVVSLWIKEGNYLSHDIINEICQMISLSIIHELVKEIKKLFLKAELFYNVLLECYRYLLVRVEIFCFQPFH
jgi:hypothetical protein